MPSTVAQRCRACCRNASLRRPAMDQRSSSRNSPRGRHTWVCPLQRSPPWSVGCPGPVPPHSPHLRHRETGCVKHRACIGGGPVRCRRRQPAAARRQWPLRRHRSPALPIAYLRHTLDQTWRPGARRQRRSAACQALWLQLEWGGCVKAVTCTEKQPRLAGRSKAVCKSSPGRAVAAVPSTNFDAPRPSCDSSLCPCTPDHPSHS